MMDAAGASRQPQVVQLDKQQLIHELNGSINRQACSKQFEVSCECRLGGQQHFRIS
jgi:hypothetical protein